MTENCQVNDCQQRVLAGEITRLRKENSELAARVLSCNAQRALDGGWLPPFEVMKLQARKVGGDFWTDIYPAQLEQMVRNGCDIRAIEPPPISAVTDDSAL